jgi:signal transduction histidine kinase
MGKRALEELPGSWDEPGLLEIYATAVEHGTPCQRELHSETNGIKGWFQVIASPLEGGLPAIWFADVTERKRQEQALRDADRRKDEFLATLAHELRNPLAPIRQGVAVADNDRANDSQRQWASSVVRRQVEHMALLLEDLLDVSHITRGTLSLRKKALELRIVVSAAVETARPLIESRRHNLTVEVPETLTLMGDPLRLSQIFANLLTNAAKYTPAGGTIRLVVSASDRAVIVRVEGNGVGLNAEDMPFLSKIFSQTRSGREQARAGWESALRSRRAWPKCTAAASRQRAPEPAKGARPPSACRLATCLRSSRARTNLASRASS